MIKQKQYYVVTNAARSIYAIVDNPDRLNDDIVVFRGTWQACRRFINPNYPNEL